MKDFLWQIKSSILVNLHILFCDDDIEGFDAFCRRHGIILTFTSWSGRTETYGL